jgi:hypothetical protein
MPMTLEQVQSKIAKLNTTYDQISSTGVIQKVSSQGAGEQSLTMLRLDQIRTEIEYWQRMEASLLAAADGGASATGIVYGQFIQPS